MQINEKAPREDKLSILERTYDVPIDTSIHFLKLFDFSIGLAFEGASHIYKHVSRKAMQGFEKITGIGYFAFIPEIPITRVDSPDNTLTNTYQFCYLNDRAYLFKSAELGPQLFAKVRKHRELPNGKTKFYVKRENNMDEDERKSIYEWLATKQVNKLDQLAEK